MRYVLKQLYMLLAMDIYSSLYPGHSQNSWTVAVNRAVYESTNSNIFTGQYLGIHACGRIFKRAQGLGNI